MFLILCGSTAILELKGFDYLERSLFFPTYYTSDKLLAYAILEAIATGSSRLNENAQKIKEEPANRSHYIFGTGGYTDEVQGHARIDGVTRVSPDDLFFL